MKKDTAIVIGAISGIILGIGILMAGLPKYNVWRAEVNISRLEADGKASLARATQERMILVEQARAEKEAAILRAEAIAIIGEAAQKYPEYRQQEFIAAFAEALQNKSIEKIIYVPTEANVPITEAGKR